MATTGFEGFDQTAHGSAPPLRGVLILLTLTAFGLAGGEVALTVDPSSPHPLLLSAFPMLGGAMVAVGTWIWDLRPLNPVGRLATFSGLTILLAAAGNVPDRWFVLVGVLAAELPIAALLHLVVAFSSWKLDGGRRWIVALAYLNSVLPQIPIYLFADRAADLRIFGIDPRPGVAELADSVQSVIGGALILWLTGFLVHRWRSAPVLAERRTLALAYGYGIFALASLPVTARLQSPLGWSVYGLFGVQIAIIAGLPVALIVAVTSHGLHRTIGLAELVSLIGRGNGTPSIVRDSLATLLDDPTLEISVGSDDPQRDESHDEDVPAIGGDRGLVSVQGPASGHVTIRYDRQRIDDPQVVREAAGVAALAIQHGRLTDELRIAHNELRKSRLRIIEAGDQQRLRLARDLHDGVQNRLVMAAMLAGRQSAGDTGLAEDPMALQREIQTAIDDLRRLAHGAMPAVLVERGLYDAVQEMTDRLPVRSTLHIMARPDLCSTTAIAGYFITAEALSNAVKHSGADHVEILIDDDHLGRGQDAVVLIRVRDDGTGGADPHGTGLRNIADRAEALGGQLLLVSELGRGTELTARLPCGS